MATVKIMLEVDEERFAALRDAGLPLVDPQSHLVTGRLRLLDQGDGTFRLKLDEVAEPSG